MNAPRIEATPFDAATVARLRAATPACERFAHFAHGSASLPPAVVYEAWETWLESERSLGAQRAIEHHGEALQAVRPAVARLINAAAHGIALLDSASHAWSAAMSGVLADGAPVHVITTPDEYGANALYLLAAQQHLSLTILPGRTASTSLAEQLDAALAAVPTGHRAVVSLSAVPTAHGIATDFDGIAQQVRAHAALLLVDASHAVGQLPIDVMALGCDLLVFPARKWLRGPKGASVLYVSDRALDVLGAPANVDVAGAHWTASTAWRAADDARRFEGSEFNPGLRLALGAACRHAEALGPARIAAHNAGVRAAVTRALHERFGWTTLEGDEARATALVTYALPAGADDGEAWVQALWQAGVNVTLVGAQSARWALEAAGVPAVLRLTPHYLNDAQDIARLLEAIEKTMPAIARG